MKKIYYELTLISKSPLHVGSGKNEEADSDLMLASNGIPFIPGSGLTGVLRSKLSKTDGELLFGSINGEETQESKVIISDAVPLSPDKSQYHFSIRDGIRLDEWSMVENKFDIQIVETNVPFQAVIELNCDEENHLEKIWENLLQTLNGEIKVGAKTSRGFGKMKFTVKKRAFVFPNELSEWMSFRPFAKDAFSDAQNIKFESSTNSDVTKISVMISMVDGFIVRQKTTNVEPLYDDFIPDYVPLMNQENKPIIPGSAWAGSFRHHMKEILREIGDKSMSEEQIDRIFGVVKDEKKYSELRFGEVVIEGGKACSYVRNAVDRFTASPKIGALYSSQIWYGGNGVLEIAYPKGALNDRERQLLALCLIDMDQGLLSVGGEASVGRGRTKITGLFVNQKDRLPLLKEMNVLCLEE